MPVKASAIRSITHLEHIPFLLDSGTIFRRPEKGTTLSGVALPGSLMQRHAALFTSKEHLMSSGNPL